MISLLMLLMVDKLYVHEERLWGKAQGSWVVIGFEHPGENYWV